MVKYLYQNRDNVVTKLTIYERIKELRQAKGMSQYDLAKKVGYEGRSAISKVENGSRDISQSMIIKYAEALGVSPGYLIYGDECEKNPTTDDDSGRTKEFIELFSKLTAEQQNLIIAQIKGILSAQ